MTRGNQRELARQKNMKKNKEITKNSAADQKDGNKGLSLENRKHRDAEAMREKQRKALERKEGGEATTSDKK